MPLSDVLGLEVGDFTFETHSEFEKVLTEMQKVIKSVVKVIEVNHFKSPAKLQIDSKKWRKIFEIIDKSREKHNFQQSNEQEITSGLIGKRFLVSGDKEIVRFLLVLLEGGITSVSDNRVNEVLGEIETKIFGARGTEGVDLLGVKTEILRNGGNLRYAGVLWDDYLDRQDILLKKHGGRQLRTRKRLLSTGEISETLTLKRKITDLSPDQAILMKHLMDQYEQLIDLEEIIDTIKILLEEEDDINDMEGLQSCFQVLKLYVQRAKIKLRASYILLSSKLELEHYPLMHAKHTKSGFMRPFVEQESVKVKEAEEVRKMIGLYGDGIVLSNAGSEGAFEFDGAGDSYFRLGRGGTKDSRTHGDMQRVFMESIRMMNMRAYFDNFRN